MVLHEYTDRFGGFYLVERNRGHRAGSDVNGNVAVSEDVVSYQVPVALLNQAEPHVQTEGREGLDIILSKFGRKSPGAPENNRISADDLRIEADDFRCWSLTEKNFRRALSNRWLRRWRHGLSPISQDRRRDRFPGHMFVSRKPRI